MARIDKFPSTPAKLIWTLVWDVIFSFACLYVMLANKDINETVFGVLAAYTFGQNAVGAIQFIGKRKTAWAPPVTSSEVTGNATDGQPAKAKNKPDWSDEFEKGLEDMRKAGQHEDGNP